MEQKHVNAFSCDLLVQNESQILCLMEKKLILGLFHLASEQLIDDL